MLSEADRAVLDESFQNTRMGGEAIHMVIGKVEDEDLALDLNRQACRFLQFEEKLQQMYASDRRRRHGIVWWTRPCSGAVFR